jgi:hypothetical protein
MILYRRISQRIKMIGKMTSVNASGKWDLISFVGEGNLKKPPTTVTSH